MVRQVDGACSSISINTRMLGVAQKSESSPEKIPQTRAEDGTSIEQPQQIQACQLADV